jgi:hypothetical protein
VIVKALSLSLSLSLLKSLVLNHNLLVRELIELIFKSNAEIDLFVAVLVGSNIQDQRPIPRLAFHGVQGFRLYFFQTIQGFVNRA